MRGGRTRNLVEIQIGDEAIFALIQVKYSEKAKRDVARSLALIAFAPETGCSQEAGSRGGGFLQRHKFLQRA